MDPKRNPTAAWTRVRSLVDTVTRDQTRHYFWGRMGITPQGSAFVLSPLGIVVMTIAKRKHDALEPEQLYYYEPGQRDGPKWRAALEEAEPE